MRPFKCSTCSYKNSNINVMKHHKETAHSHRIRPQKIFPNSLSRKKTPASRNVDPPLHRRRLTRPDPRVRKLTRPIQPSFHRARPLRSPSPDIPASNLSPSCHTHQNSCTYKRRRSTQPTSNITSQAQSKRLSSGPTRPLFICRNAGEARRYCDWRTWPNNGHRRRASQRALHESLYWRTPNGRKFPPGKNKQTQTTSRSLSLCPWHADGGRHGHLRPISTPPWVAKRKP